MLKEALRLAEAGFAIHWLHTKSKAPIGKDWSSRPVASLSELQVSYKDGNNVGVRLGKWSQIGDYFLHVIDLDIRKPEMAEDAHARLSELLPAWRSFPMVQSGSGGGSRHVYLLVTDSFSSKKLAHSENFSMVWDERLKKDVKKWDWEIELFGTGKQVAIPPSIHPDTGKPYRWISELDFEMIEMGIGPIVDVETIREIVNDEPESQQDFDPDSDRTKPIGLSIDEARQVLADLPDDQYLEDRDGWLNVGMALHHEFGGSDEAYRLWCDFSKRSEKFDKKDQRAVWKSFKPKAKMLRMATLMSAAKEARLMSAFDDEEDEDFDDLAPAGKPTQSSGGAIEDDLLADDSDEEPELDLLGDPVTKRQQKLNKAQVEHELGAVPAKVRKLNRKHAIARVKGKTVILDFHADGDVSYGSPSDLHAYYENNRVATEKATEPVTKWWMRHKDRREYPNGIVFAPNKEVKGAYNHWQGFSVEPNAKGSCRRFLKHLYENICRGNEENYRYLLGWLAHLIQRPEEKPGVAVVLRGKKGTGKDTVGDYVGGLFPHHHVKIANQEQLTGKFNQHQEKCLLLHVEEGFWAGSKNSEGPLKHLITSEHVLIEPKGINPFKVTSVLRLFITSNEKWVVPASADERRYFVLDVGSDKIQDTAYFAKLRDEMWNGGRAALLDYLMNYDISDFNVRAVPATQALTEQKIEGLRNIDLWWFSMLETGEIDLGSGGLDGENEVDDWARGRVYVDRKDFRNAYMSWMRTRRHDGDPLREREFGKRLKTMLPSLGERRPRIGGRQVAQYTLPDLDVCRSEFDAYMGSEIGWPESFISSDTEPEDDFDDLLG